ncbi:T9SS type A sorting domain-containing protein [bacterium]|nr:T9SS type A sorting domain-containing protein [bacterium]
MLEWHYLQRTYGNPGVNVDRKTWDAWEDIAYSPQSALMKPFATTSTWRAEGPTNIGGRMRAVTFHPTETETIFAGGASGGVWRSTDLGQSWTALSDFEPRINIGALAIDATNPSIIYAGTGEPLPGGAGRRNGSPFYDGIGVLRSADGGDNWELLPWSGNSAVHRIALHPHSSDTLLVATRDNLYKSTDGGQNWGNVLSGVISDVVYKPDNPGIVYAAVGNDYGGSANGIYVSYTGGSRFSWQKLATNFAPGDSCGRIVMSIPTSDPDRIYAAVAANRNRLPDSDADFKGIFVSHDAGQTWERKLSAISNGFTRGQAYYDLTIAASPTQPDVVMLGGIDMYRSTNGGEGFSKQSRWELRVVDPNSPAYVHADQHHIAFKPDDPNTFIVGNDGGVFISTNRGDTWEARNEGLATVQFYGIAYAPSNPSLLYGGTQDNSNMRQKSPGETEWVYVGSGDGGRIAVDPQNSNLMYFCMNSTPFRTFDGGTLMEPLTSGLAGYRFNWIRPMVLDPDGERLYTATNEVHRLSPASSATSWLTITVNSLTNGIITDLEIPELNSRFMYASTSTGEVYFCRNLIALDTEWEGEGNGLPGRWVTDIHVDWGQLYTVYACVSGYGTGHAFKSTDGGDNWTDISGDLPNIPANTIIPSRVDSNTVFLATDLGVWYTTNGGTNWKQYGNGLPNVVCYDMRLTPENRLVVGTYGRGMWSTDGLVSIDAPRQQPEAFSLAPNYPNPFGPGIAETTTLRFNLQNTAEVTLQVYDAAGKLVATPAQGSYQAGSHTASFHAGTLPAGSYFAVLRSGNSSVTRKMLIIR